MSSRAPSLQTHECSLPDGRTLAYASTGSPGGVPVVVHHGTPGSRLFAALSADVAASEGIRLVVPDRPGYGRSAPPPDGWTWWDWRDDLQHLLAAESIDRAGLLGYSGGGPFALAAADGDWATRVALISTALPPVEDALATLSAVPFALRGLFRLFAVLASIRGPDAVVEQYTDRSIPARTASAVADAFHEALRQGARAVERESQLFANRSLDPELDLPVRAWHGTRDENAPVAPVRSFLEARGETLVPSETDHLETFLEHQRDAFAWLRTA